METDTELVYEVPAHRMCSAYAVKLKDANHKVNPMQYLVGDLIGCQTCHKYNTCAIPNL